jgi:UDP-glucose 4-epimerase
MRILVTGSSGHLGEALVRRLREANHEVIGIDIKASRFTTIVGSVSDRSVVAECMTDMDAVCHAATLHKPHVGTHDRQEFIDTNITGTLNLLEEAASVGVGTFIFTSTTSVFGNAMKPPPGAPTAWITENVVPVPKNIYGVTKAAAEDLCQLFHQDQNMSCLILRTSRFFPEVDDSKTMRDAYDDTNLKVNELLFRRVDLDDAVSAHILALDRAQSIGFGRYIVSATTPFSRSDVADLRSDAVSVVRRLVPEFEAVYASRNWRMFPTIGRVYDNTRARNDLGWQPTYDFYHALDRLKSGQPYGSTLARQVGEKGYHSRSFEEGPYPVS